VSEEQTEATRAPWWEATPPGKTIPLAFVKIDRVASTREWSELSPEQVNQRYARYTAGVESIARSMGAAQPLVWQGDGVMLFLTDGADGPAPLRGFQAARLLWERVTVDLGISARIAVHVAHVPWNPETGKLRHATIDRCGHLEHVAPEQAIAVSEDVWLALPNSDRMAFAPLGFTVRDGTPAWVFPGSAAERKQASDFREWGDLERWGRFREYARGSEIGVLRYVGLRLARKEPPALRIEDVFVPLAVQVRRGPRVPQRELRMKETEEKGGLEATEEAGWLRATPFGGGMPDELGPAESFASVFRDRRAIVVLGDPGSGKTTLLRWLAFVAAGGPQAVLGAFGIGERLLPVVVSVGALADVRRELGATCSVTDALARYFHGRHIGSEDDLRGFLERALGAGDCLVLLDGLDEVKSVEREEIRAWLETFASAYARNRFVVTSRHVGFTGFTLPDGIVTTIQPFTDEQVKRYTAAFTREYYRLETKWPDPPAEAREADQLLAAIRESPRLTALARNPFLLSALALVHRAEGRLPRHRVQFYAIVARALCETWGHARRIVAREPERALAFEEEAIPILGELARQMHEEYPDGVAPEDFVLNSLVEALANRRGVGATEAAGVAREFLRRTSEETQLLLERGPARWGFLHLTFQEFFAAAGLHAAEQFEGEADRHVYDPRWEEVLRLGVGYLALVQNRPIATRRFVEKIFKHREHGLRAPLNQLPRQQEAVAALLAAEAGDTIPAALQDEIAGKCARWLADIPNQISQRVAAEVGLTEFREPVVRHLVKLLRNSHRSTRARAASALGALRSEAAIPPLLKVLEELKEEDDDAPVGRRAAEALGMLRAESAVPRLVEALSSKSIFVRNAAVKALGAFPAELAVPALLDALKSNDEYVRGPAAQALGALGGDTAVPALVEALKDESDHVRQNAAKALGTLRAPAAVPALLGALEDDAPLVRLEVAEALAALRVDKAVPALVNQLKSPKLLIAMGSAEALGRLPADVVEPALLEALNEGPSFARVSAACVLWRLRPEAAVPTLLEALSDKEPRVRRMAADALGALRVKTAVPALLQAIKDKEPFVRAGIVGALGVLRAEGAVPALLEMLKDSHERVRTKAAEALAAIPAGGAVPALMRALKDEAKDVRWSAVRALGKLRASVAAPAILRALRNRDEGIATAAAEALGELGNEAAIGPLVRYAKRWTSEDYQRLIAVEALFRIAEANGPERSARRARCTPPARKRTRRA